PLPDPEVAMPTPRSTPADGPTGPEDRVQDGKSSRTGAPQIPPPVRGRRAHAGPPADETMEPSAWDRTHLPPPGPAPEAAAEPAGRSLQLRPRTVRAKVICVLMVPVVSLIALWG